MYSPIIGSIKVIRSGKVKRAKLYYLRNRKGKSARISEKIKKSIGIDISEQASEVVKDVKVNENIPQTPVEESKTEKKDKSITLKSEQKKEDLKNKKK